MSVFGSIMSKIFNAAETAAGKGEHPSSATPPTEVPPSTAAPGSATASSASGGSAQPVNTTIAAPEPAPASGQPAPSAPQAASQPVDVEAVLAKMASGRGGDENWRTSIVDLLKVLDLDSSLSARKELANEMNVHAGADGSAEENIALHKAVMQKLAENGGKVPESMKG